MNDTSSYRQILRSTALIGGASVINILVALVRTKVVAVLLGPAGVGLISLLQNLMSTASTLAALGLGTAGTRQIAEAASRSDERALAATRRALFWGTLALAVIGAVFFWFLRDLVATLILDAPDKASHVGWLAIGVGLSVASGSQSALLSGLRRVGDVAKVSMASSLLAAILGIAAVTLWGAQGILALVLAAPLASLLVGHLYVASLPRARAPRTPLTELVGQWSAFLQLGVALMLAALAVAAGQLAVRTLIQRELGAVALGHFQAAWMISMTYVGLVMSAMGSDYYPRLTAVIHDRQAANRMVNEQAEVTLLLVGPMLVGMLALSPWVIELLYSHEFKESTSLLRWQILGDVLKVASWPLGFVVLAAGDGRAFVWSESLAMAVFVALSWLCLPLLGIQATGIAFLGMYLIYLPTVYGLARRRTGFRCDNRLIKLFLVLTTMAVAVHITALLHESAAIGLGIVLAVAFGLHSLARLGCMAHDGGSFSRLSAAARRAMLRKGARHE